MLLNERNITLPTEYARKQVYSLIDNFIFNNIEQKARQNGWSLDQSKHNFYKIVRRNKGYILLGDIRTKDKKTNRNIVVTIFVVSDDIMKNNNALFFPEENEIHINEQLLFGSKNILVNNVIHELIHGIQKFKGGGYSLKNTESYEEWFLYLTEQKEFEAKIGELAHNIMQMYEFSKRRKDVLFVLDVILNAPREVFSKGLLEKAKNDIVQEMFEEHFHFIKIISGPPILPDDTKENRYKNKMYRRTSDRCYKHFKQKLANLYQNLKEKTK